MKTLVFIEQRSGKLKNSAFEVLSAASKVAGGDVSAVIVGSGIAGLASELQGYGCETVYTVEDAAFADYQCLNYCNAVAEAINQSGAELIIGSASPMGKDLFPRLAARLDGGILTDVTEFSLAGSDVNAKKPMYAGKVIANVAITGGSKKFLTLRPNVFPVEKSGQGAANATSVSASAADSGLTLKEIRKGSSDRPDLTEASVIISGGRAMGGADAFKILFECADTIGATVGASRAAVDSGYAPHDMQVGQTGKTVNPNLYVACGISGAIQHMAGMRTSKVIVAINTDPEAPIFGIADYGIVADLFAAVPILTEKFKALG